MGNEVILAVAGSGKTTHVLDRVSKHNRSLIVTYTNANYQNIVDALVRTYGRVPDNVSVLTYFSFLYSFCFRPYCSYTLRDKAFQWEAPPQLFGKGPGASTSDIRHYMTQKRYLYANRVAKYLEKNGVVPKILSRLDTHFDQILIDEVQDFAANDFNLILSLGRAKLDNIYVGDYHQHTFDTSRDGGTRKNLHKKGLDYYKGEFTKAGFTVDTTSLGKSYRCSPTVCEFIRETTGINIESHRSDITNVTFVTDRSVAAQLYHDNSKVKLFLQEHLKYNCHSNNWGRSKGLDHYEDVCVVLNKKTLAAIRDNTPTLLPESTWNKLYVACSRARGNLFLLEESHLRSFKQVA